MVPVPPSTPSRRGVGWKDEKPGRITERKSTLRRFEEQQYFISEQVNVRQDSFCTHHPAVLHAIRSEEVLLCWTVVPGSLTPSSAVQCLEVSVHSWLWGVLQPGLGPAAAAFDFWEVCILMEPGAHLTAGSLTPLCKPFQPAALLQQIKALCVKEDDLHFHRDC